MIKPTCCPHCKERPLAEFVKRFLNSNPKPLNCIKCGSKAELLTRTLLSDGVERYSFNCSGCGYEGEERRSLPIALELWNGKNRADKS